MVGDDSSKVSVHGLFRRWSKKPSHRAEIFRDRNVFHLIVWIQMFTTLGFSWECLRTTHSAFSIPEYLKNKSHFSPDCRKQPFQVPSFERIHSEMGLCHSANVENLLLLLQKIQMGFSRVQLWIFRLSSCYSEQNNCLNHSQWCPWII